jgi:TolB-like protein/tetratricopeptide (TPR) repeat protein
MEGESPTQVSTPAGAVFLSYASQDAEAAKRICKALRAGGIEVWFDQSELRGGDAWDHQIRERIHDCRLFVPVISASTEHRDEGYFRREWSLAVDRTRDMVHKRTFLVPVVIDGTPERGAAVPEKFHELQWTRLPGGETPPAFVERIRRLLTPEGSRAITASSADLPRGSATAPSVRRSSFSKTAMWVAGAIVAGACGYFVAGKFWLSKHAVQPAPPVALTAPQPPPSAVAAAAFNPPPHSIAVLPFVNMSGDKDQEYFSEGLTEELLNSLSRINELQVAARTSSFSFQGEHPDIATVAHKLNVGAVLEGSVRRSTHTVRVTTQLVNGITGFHIWSQTYDRGLGDVLQLQTEIATAVASALKVALLGGEAAKIEVGGTRNAAAFDAYLRATKAYWGGWKKQDAEVAIAGYTEAVRLDPDYALAYAARSLAFEEFAVRWATTAPARRNFIDKAHTDADKAIALAPALGEGHLALARVYETLIEFKRASEAYERAVALAPGNVRILRNHGQFAVFMGRGDDGLTALRRAVALDPLNPVSHVMLGFGLYNLRRYAEAIEAFKDAQARSLQTDFAADALGFAYYQRGDFEAARSSCEKLANNDAGQACLAVTYERLGRHARQNPCNRRRHVGHDVQFHIRAVGRQCSVTRLA